MKFWLLRYTKGQLLPLIQVVKGEVWCVKGKIRVANINEYNIVIDLIKRNFERLTLTSRIELITLPFYFYLKRVYVYELHNKIIGCVVLGAVSNTLSYLVVEKYFRKKGIGSSLLQYAENKFRGRIRIFSNKDQTNYYLKRGYRFTKNPKMIKRL